MTRAYSIWALLTVLMLVVPLSSEQRPPAPTLAEVLARAADRATALADTDRILACEERYRQKFDRVRAVVAQDGVMGHANTVGTRNEVTAEAVDKREWLAEFAILATPANEDAGFPWMEFRDVVSVDDKPVRAGAPLLKTLQDDLSPAASARAVDVSRSAATLVFGRFIRGVDIPRAAVMILHPVNQPRFEFRKGGERNIDGVRTWEIKFKENRKPTIIRASGDKDAVSTGSFWIDPATGNVRVSLLKSPDSSTVYDEQTVTYREDPATGLWLPAELKERVVDDDAGLRLEATATFSNWRVVPRKR
jgi:hypothetical protein